VDLSKLATELEQDFSESRLIKGVGEVAVPRVPTDLGLLCVDLFEGRIHDESEAFSAAERAGHLQTLVSFTWEEDGASSFESSLEILTFGETSYLTISPDDSSDQDWEAFVAVEDATPEVWRAILVDICKDNGVGYGVELFSSLPTRVETVAIGTKQILACFYSYLAWDESRSPGAWQTSAEYLPEVLAGNVSLQNAAAGLLDEDTTQARFHYVTSYVAAVYRDPAQELAVVAS